MHPRFLEMVGDASGRGIRISTNTNATLIGEARTERCVQSGLHALNVGSTAQAPPLTLRSALDTRCIARARPPATVARALHDRRLGPDPTKGRTMARRQQGGGGQPNTGR